ncbi:MAG: nitrate/nitrite transporter NrtS [Gammaproteobacteria bacterium]
MTFLEAAMHATVVKKSLKVAAIVGTILVVINYGDKFFPLALVAGDWLKMALTYCVPYCVSTYAAASTMAAR